ncbi:MAG: hydrogenase 4 subunit B [Betaproteobacteria bacterium]|nr:hydrogenase 4 subunit B [Betaproteobacteria bacterium]
MSAGQITPLAISLAGVIAWIVIGLAGVFSPGNLRLVARYLFPAGALAGLVVAAAGAWAIAEGARTLVLPLGLPDLPFHLRIDSLSAFFLLLLGAVAAGVSVFAAGYFRRGQGTPPGLQCLYYHVFLASMALVLLADDAYGFMVCWETMALSSYFLVTSDHRSAEIRRAGFLYLLIAHIGALAILLCFGVLQGGGGDYTFDAMRQLDHTPRWGGIAFALALFGFGAKAGIIPLHAWLPEAHPAAPSPVSALMSAVMLKTAVYGFLRVMFDLLDVKVWWWGVIVLVVGLTTALYGVVFSAVQSDMKRLLAYSSIENIGIVYVGAGLALMFLAYDMTALAALALTATLYHTLNHAFFKSLLFLATGSVLHATRERALGRLGGLIHRMPWVAWLALVGTLAVAGLPPLNGFVSEWLLLQAFLFTPGLPQNYLNMLVPVAAASVALTAALAGYVMVKFYGVIFLGQPREERLADARDCGPWERAGLVWLAAGCVLLGILPVFVIRMIDEVTRPLLGQGLGNAASNWWLLAPIQPERASYGPLLFLVAILAAVAFAFLAVRAFYHGRVRRGAAWDCGFPGQTARMQDSAEGFGQPVRQVFEPFFRMRRELPGAFDSAPRYRVVVEDPLWYWVYLPVARAADRLTGLVTLLQRGRISVYLMYGFITLLFLLLFVR